MQVVDLKTENGQQRHPVQRRAKRLVDIVVAGFALIILLPVMAATTVAIWIAMGRPILFRQARPGRDERLFEIIKFRTMLPKTDSDGREIPGVQRVTGLGWFLRRTSLDELPQLWCVLRGDLSLVGPRPLLVDYLPVYSERERLRHSVRPGITGLAQTNGRNSVGWDERLRLDIEYVETWTLWLDFKILAKTALMVIRPTGVSRDPDLEGSLDSIRDSNGRQAGIKRWTGTGVRVVVFEGSGTADRNEVHMAEDQ